jgi:hypothetical protein
MRCLAPIPKQIRSEMDLTSRLDGSRHLPRISKESEARRVVERRQVVQVKVVKAVKASLPKRFPKKALFRDSPKLLLELQRQPTKERNKVCPETQYYRQEEKEKTHRGKVSPSWAVYGSSPK